MQQILLVEDSEEYQKIVVRALNHYQIVCVENAEDALSRLEQTQFALILLDIHLPVRDGYSLLSEIQSNSETSSVPVICLTGKTAVTDKITAFSLGADDYIIKPFDPLELRARVDAKLNKTSKSKSSGNLLFINKLEISHNTHRVFVHEGSKKNEVELTQTEFKILSCLARRPDQAFSRDQLLVAVWGEDARVLDRVVDTHICSLRKKLGPEGSFIKAVPGIGYKIQPSRTNLKRAA